MKTQKWRRWKETTCVVHWLIKSNKQWLSFSAPFCSRFDDVSSAGRSLSDFVFVLFLSQLISNRLSGCLLYFLSVAGGDPGDFGHAHSPHRPREGAKRLQWSLWQGPSGHSGLEGQRTGYSRQDAGEFRLQVVDNIYHLADDIGDVIWSFTQFVSVCCLFLFVSEKYGRNWKNYLNSFFKDWISTLHCLILFVCLLIRSFIQ